MLTIAQNVTLIAGLCTAIHLPHNNLSKQIVFSYPFHAASFRAHLFCAVLVCASDSVSSIVIASMGFSFIHFVRFVYVHRRHLNESIGIV